jgi:hypothetical protein
MGCRVIAAAAAVVVQVGSHWLAGVPEEVKWKEHRSSWMIWEIPGEVLGERDDEEMSPYRMNWLAFVGQLKRPVTTVQESVLP